MRFPVMKIYFWHVTLEYGINLPAHLLIFMLFSKQHALISYSILVHINIFDQRVLKIMLFRMKNAHFRVQIIASIKLSSWHVYCFYRIFQYSEVSIKRTVSIKHTGQADSQMFLLSVLYNLKICCKPLNV